MCFFKNYCSYLQIRCNSHASGSPYNTRSSLKRLLLGSKRVHLVILPIESPTIWILFRITTATELRKVTVWTVICWCCWFKFEQSGHIMQCGAIQGIEELCYQMMASQVLLSVAWPAANEDEVLFGDVGSQSSLFAKLNIPRYSSPLRNKNYSSLRLRLICSIFRIWTPAIIAF